MWLNVAWLLAINEETTHNVPIGFCELTLVNIHRNWSVLLRAARSRWMEQLVMDLVRPVSTLSTVPILLTMPNRIWLKGDRFRIALVSTSWLQQLAKGNMKRPGQMCMNRPQLPCLCMSQRPDQGCTRDMANMIQYKEQPVHSHMNLLADWAKRIYIYS